MIDSAMFSMDRLISEMLGTDWTMPGNHWRMDCEIIPKYRPRNPVLNTRCVILHRPSGRYLRHSKGPRQGHIWDIYGDDYQCPEIALIALSMAPPPVPIQSSDATPSDPE